MPARTSIRWSTRFGFMMAAVGFAVGLGNIWRFPYVTGENGGGAFVVVYLVCVVAIALPILVGEILVGRRGRSDPAGAVAAVAVGEGGSARWGTVGGLNLAAAFLITTFYCVIAGWVLHYLLEAVVRGFAGVDAGEAAGRLESLLDDPLALTGWAWLALAASAAVIAGGVRSGIERVVNVLMPLLFALLGGLVLYNVFAGGMPEAVEYLFAPDFSKVTGATVLAAVGQAFFSIGVAMAGMMAYAAYLPRSVSIARSAGTIVAMDTLVALVAGLVVFPMVFRFGLDPASGEGLIFLTLPVAFAQMPGGHLVSVVFFVLLAVAAVTSMVGVLEPITAWVERKTGRGRVFCTVAATAVVALVSLPAVLAHNLWAEGELLGINLMTVYDYLPYDVLLPLGGLLIAVFVGWRVGAETARTELALASPWMFLAWRRLLRYVAAPAVLVIFLLGLVG
ncbi:MAG: sodium-dependent transporter [Gammaproteobacteria bacterium]|nr:sodium-dependent transporter [Gammaproteobacteria bacterium]